MNIEVSSVKATAPTTLFQGYNSVLGQGLSTAVQGKSATTGASSEVICSVSTTIEELAKSLSIDQSLSVGFGPVGGADEKMEFMASLKVTTYSVSVTVYARHGTGGTSFTDVSFEQGISIPTDDASANQFVRAYGDSFVSSVQTGGEYMAVYTFYSQTREEQASLVTSLKANGIFDGVSVGGSLQTAMTNFIKVTTVNYAFRQKVTGLLNPALPLPSDFVAFAVKFPSIPIDAPVVTSISSTGYEAVPNAGNAFDKVSANRNYFTGGSIDSGLTGSLTTITQALNQMNWISNIYNFYGGFSDQTLITNTSTATSDINAIKTQMSAFGTAAAGNFPALNLPSLKNGTPTLKFNIQTSSYWGGDGGSPFDDIDISTYISRKTRVSAIGLRTGNRTDQLRTSYIDDTGQFSTKTHGGGGGSDRGTLQILEGQFITRISGRSGNRLDQVQFQISDGRGIGGGGGGGSAFDWSPPSGSFVMGFSGRSGNEVDRLQVYYGKFKPASWII
ncbi:hypothetical protein RvVAT039_25800 [Agrobacterium vitis]|uniref:jacalin-like lectin n=1 Tax=Agrobacterium vitis TaxID=373 RepID=UPI0015DBC097|nr:hypothetical protein [Agrobacterium vitis]BCH65364.1 hypothetical protein RvVAT039_25800 [Agrobacterium vitis]